MEEPLSVVKSMEGRWKVGSSSEGAGGCLCTCTCLPGTNWGFIIPRFLCCRYLPCYLLVLGTAYDRPLEPLNSLEWIAIKLVSSTIQSTFRRHDAYLVDVYQLVTQQSYVLVQTRCSLAYSLLCHSPESFAARQSLVCVCEKRKECAREQRPLSCE